MASKFHIRGYIWLYLFNTVATFTKDVISSGRKLVLMSEKES